MSGRRADLYTRVTNRIVADLEQGVRPWFKPWNAEHAAGRITRPLRANGQPYKGINVLMLWGEALAQGFACPFWMTYKQAQELGGQVRKGEHGSLVVYADRIHKTETGDNGEETEREIPFLKGYTVFNCVEQIDGLPEHFYARPSPPLPAPLRIEAADRFFAATGADIRHGGARAYYAEGPDYVQMPPFESFRDAESHAATLAHELTHWTKHGKRLAREFGRKRWGDEGYAAEELVAELGAAFLCADLGDHAGAARRSRQLHRVVARRAEERQARDLHRRRPCATRRRLPARLAAARLLRCGRLVARAGAGDDSPIPPIGRRCSCRGACFLCLFEGNIGPNDDGRWREHDRRRLRHDEPGIAGCRLVVSIGISESRIEFGNGVADGCLKHHPVAELGQIDISGEPIGHLADRQMRFVLRPQRFQVKP